MPSQFNFAGAVDRGEWAKVAAHVAQLVFEESPYRGGRGVLKLVPPKDGPVLALFDDRRDAEDPAVRVRGFGRVRQKLREQGYFEAGYAAFPPAGMPDSGVVTVLVLTTRVSDEAFAKVEQVVRETPL
jgi:hypothetical protein